MLDDDIDQFGLEVADLMVLLVVINATLNLIRTSSELHMQFVAEVTGYVKRHNYKKKSSLPRQQWSELLAVVPDQLFWRMLNVPYEEGMV
jgi:hypothetical protein